MSLVSTHFVPFDFLDFRQIGDVTDAAVRDEDVLVDQTGDRQPTVDVFDQMGQAIGVGFVLLHQFSHETVSKNHTDHQI